MIDMSGGMRNILLTRMGWVDLGFPAWVHLGFVATVLIWVFRHGFIWVLPRCSFGFSGMGSFGFCCRGVDLGFPAWVFLFFYSFFVNRDARLAMVRGCS